ncbi:GDSL-type esterase/lipase family protein [Daejeonella sp.]|uniref:GDSL-type esterase/lipase family protein n=1 Tax=Daejeonella sp. TaxID=2805397 RepID=UPI0025C4585E|nr:GDSL-type esterase/lipase family protein [Daejeonella sp.]
MSHFITNDSFAQIIPPFYNDIIAFKKNDQVVRPESGSILFVGSSSFTMWKDVQNDFPAYKILNRGFGGSGLTDLIRYAPDIIYPYQPKQVVIYCGENDFVSSPNANADTVLTRFSQLFGMIRTRLPKAHILFVSIKPSPSRAKYMPEMVRANAMIKSFLKKKSKTGYVDVYNKMLLADGSPIPNIFLADKLHMNRSGYEIWQKAILPHLMK